jgi:hypothetical protein
VAALEKQNQQLGWQVAMLADRAAGAEKAAPAPLRRPAPGSVPVATQASITAHHLVELGTGMRLTAYLQQHGDC